MGLSIAIGGAISMVVVLILLSVLSSGLDQIFTETVTSSAINEVKDSISKTSLKIN